MKKITLLMVMTAVCYVTNAQIYLSEILVNAPSFEEPFPPGVTKASDDGFAEYIELRGTPGSTIAAGTYIVTVEGDTDSEDSPQNRGDIDRILDLGGLQFGSNGYLVLLRENHPYTIDQDATANTEVLENSGNAASGRIEDQSLSIFLITAPNKPSGGDDIDQDDDGVVDADSVFSNWTILDQIALLDDDGSKNGLDEVSYASISFVRNASLYPANIKVPSGSVVIEVTAAVGYAARIGNSTGSTADDWVGGNLTKTYPDFGMQSRTVPEDYIGELLNHKGAANTVPETLGVTKFVNSAFTIYSPMDGIFTIATKNDFTLKSVEVFNTLGQSVKKQGSSLNEIDLTSLDNGLYLVQINGNTDLIKIVR